MMEVKQNTAVDLNDLLTSSKNNIADEDDDAVMQNLSDRPPHGLVNCDLIKQNDESGNITKVENGNNAMTSLIKDVDEDDDVGEDLNATVNSELEDALLEEDDVLPEVPNTTDIDKTLSATDEILAEKVETSNSTTSSNVRDPGDDLDTLLSKINDIVEDCIEKETQNTVSNAIKLDQAIDNKLETPEDTTTKESVLVVEGKNVIDDSNLLEEKKADQAINDIGKKLELSEENENLIEKETLITSDLPIVTSEYSNKVEEVANNGNNKSYNDEHDAQVAETEISNDKSTPQSNSIDNIAGYNLNLEKTDEANAEIVQDNEITSNSNDVSDDVKTATTTVDNGGMSSPKEVDSIEINKKAQNNEESEAAVDKIPTLTNEKTPTEQTIPSGCIGNDESDDEIVFYVDQPSETEKSKETEIKSVDTKMKKMEASLLNKETTSVAKNTHQDDDDVVLLLDDDEEDVSQIKEDPNKKGFSIKEEDEQNESGILSSDTSTEANEKNIVIDNSDNARDDFSAENSNEKNKQVDKTEVTQTPEETNSNCSSSSNLLQEAKSIKTVADEPTPEEAENEEDDDEGDIELIAGEVKDSESLEKIEHSEITPPAKRIRLSEDDEQVLKKPELCDGSDEVESLNVAEKKQDSQENLEAEKSSVPILSTLKRPHDVIEVEADEKSDDSKEGINKKQKTDILQDDVILSDKIDGIVDDKKSEVLKYEHDGGKNIKAVPSYEPIRLYPAPEFGVLNSKLPMSLDFLKKFRKSFDNMTKQDLEELVLQKVVEAIIHRSEFSEMRELIEKQEKLINAHRTKISELSKQFRDLEMVHNRVVKDIEQRNSQFIMPVKITRAVGLQVYIPNKKSLAEATSSIAGTIIPSSPQRPVTSQTSTTSSTSLTPAQRQYLSSQTDAQQRPTGTASSCTGNTGNVRRGCVQKITPIRPVPGSAPSASSAPTQVASAAYRNTSNHSAVTQPRILNKNATTAANSAAIQRPRYLATNQDGQRVTTQQQISRSPNIPANSQRVVANTSAQSKPTSSVATTVQRRSEPLPSQTGSSSSSIVDNYINTLTHLTGGNTAVSITPAKPKEKAVIDLTDEDETSVQSVGSQNASQMSGTQVPRRSLPVQNSSNSQYGRSAPPLARVPPANQMANNKNRQMSSMQAPKNNSFTSISTPPGTSITRINVAPNATNIQRVKYNHPAPLPATPPQAFNPLWKLPPPRPTIRISNLDNGIVISWTMEESMDRHAECVSYQIYAYQETSGPPMVDSWRHVGDVKAMLLPMAVTLTQFQEGQRYYFAVRAVDCHQRYGPFSLPKTWS